MKKKFIKGFISIEIVVIAAVVLIGGLTGLSAFLKNGQNAQSQSATAMNNTIDMIGEEFDFGVGNDGMSETPEITENLNPINAIPAGAYYLNTKTNATYNVMPEAVSEGDIYIYKDFLYKYSSSNDGGGWRVYLATTSNGVTGYVSDYSVTSKTESEYSIILESINGVKVTSLKQTFSGCSEMVVAPNLPNGIVNMEDTFTDCKKLAIAPLLPESVTNIAWAFNGCTSLTSVQNLPSEITNMNGTFSGCTLLTNVPLIPSKVVNMTSTFRNCTSLITVSFIPSSVTKLYGTFYNCTSLTGEIEINAKPSMYNNCFAGTTKPIKITGVTTSKSQLANTATNNNVTY